MASKDTGGKVSRRKFFHTSTMAAGLVMTENAAPAIITTRSPNDTLGLGQIGVGVRGYQLMEEALKDSKIQFRAVCDLYDGFLARGIRRASSAVVGANVFDTKRYQEVLQRGDVDAVIIATPDHWHTTMALDAVEAGKHVYLEKPFTNTLKQAKQLTKAVRESKIVFQLGHQLRSNPAVWKARELVTKGVLGQVVHVRTQHYRNSRLPYLRWYGFYDDFEMPSDADAEHIDWEAFQANVRRHPFHPHRFFHWRCYWDYSNGVAGDLLSHALDQVNAILGMGIPETCVSTGGVYYWRDGRETPDTWNAVFDYPQRGLSIVYSSVAMSSHYGSGIQIMGKDAALDLSRTEVNVFAEGYSTRYRDEIDGLKEKHGGESGIQRQVPIATYRPEVDPGETSHVGNWLRAIREGSPTRSNIDTAWDEIATVLMSVESYRRGCRMRWDREREDIV